MKKKDSRRRIRIFYGILVIPTVLWLILSVIGVAKFLDYDTGEKRFKHEISEDAGLSDITTELESYYNDRVPFRSVMLSINSTLEWAIELPYNKVIEPILIHIANASMEKKKGDQTQQMETSASADQTGNIGEESQETTAGMSEDAVMNPDEVSANDSVNDSESTSDKLSILPATYETPNESGYYPYKLLASEVIQGRDGWLFMTESYQDFTGENMPSEERLAEKTAALEQLNQIFQNKGIEFYVFTIPNKNVVYPEYMPSLDQVEYSAANAFEDYVHAHTSVSYEYLDDEMLGSKIYGQLYYKLDTHWNNRGALAGYAYMRNTLGLPVIHVSDYEAIEDSTRYGDLSILTGLPEANFEPDININMSYKPEIGQELVRGNDDYIDEVISQNTENDQTMVMVGDSYRHSLLPYLSRDYAHMYSLNIQKINDEMIDLINSADIVILVTVERNLFSMPRYDNGVQWLTELMQ